MSIMDFFRTPAAPAPGASAVANPLAPNPGQATPAGGPAAFPEVVQNDTAPLAEYAKLYEADPNAKAPSPLVPDLTVTPASMQQHAASIDFSKVIDPALAEKAMKGDMASFMAVMNKVGQASYAQAASASAKITEMALTKQSETFMSEHLPRALRENAINQQITTDNPIFNNPAVSPVLAGLETQMSQKYPTESAAQISARTKAYLSGLAREIVKSEGGVVTDSATALAGARSADTTDWSKWLE